MEKRNYLENIAKEIRKETLNCIASIGIGHVGGSLSIADVLAVLYFEKMNIDPSQPNLTTRDRFVLSKGHGGPAVYATLAIKGYFDKSLLSTLNASNTTLPSHTDMNKTIGIDMTTGSLGQGFSAAVGMATAMHMDSSENYVYVVIGDGESQEGQIWEAAMFAGNRKLDTLIAFTDVNKLQIDGAVADINDISPLDKKWEAFKWDVQVVDGHDVIAISDAIDRAKLVKGKPSMILLNTIKGKGLYFIEGQASSHNMPLNKEQAEEAIMRLFQ